MCCLPTTTARCFVYLMRTNFKFLFEQNLQKSLWLRSRMSSSYRKWFTLQVATRPNLPFAYLCVSNYPSTHLSMCVYIYHLLICHPALPGSIHPLAGPRFSFQTEFRCWAAPSAQPVLSAYCCFSEGLILSYARFPSVKTETFGNPIL